MFESAYASRASRLAVSNAAVAMDRIRDATRELLLEHLREHGKRLDWRPDCPTCARASESLHHVDEVLAGDSFL